jgi:Do/DeqQ family serine protease
MAKAAALLLIGLAGAGLVPPARGAETDPARRSLVVQAVERASPAVVNISTEEIVEQRGGPFPFPHDPFFDEFFRDFFDTRPRRYTRNNLGSGVVVDADGDIVTNVHVILRASRIHVTVADGREFDAKLIGADADSDVAVLRVESKDRLPVVEMGTSADLMIGETVIAIGNPFGLSHTVTTGVVSAVGRSLRGEDRTYTDFIQTDASINPGNSGGPLLDIHGRLIGINTAIYSKAQGIGFAIPVDRVRRVMHDLVSYGEVRHAWVGLTVQDLNPGLARHFDVRAGVVVTEVEPDSPAAKAGIARGDAVTHVDGRPVHSREEFEQRVQDHVAGQQMTLTRRRDDRDEEVRLAATPFPAERADDLAWALIGVALGENDDGLVVERVRARSPAARVGVEPGDRLLGLGGTAVTTRAAFRRRMIELRGARNALVSIGRGRYAYKLQIPFSRSE